MHNTKIFFYNGKIQGVQVQSNTMYGMHPETALLMQDAVSCAHTAGLHRPLAWLECPMWKVAQLLSRVHFKEMFMYIDIADHGT